MNIFEEYGIKEVADVTLYSIELDENDDEIYVPVLYLDTLKVSTVEETAEQTSARGGLGNPELIIWDYGKEITVNLEDALYTPASQSMTWGGKLATKSFSLKGIYSYTLGEIQKEIPIKVIIENFNNFKLVKASDEDGTGLIEEHYLWTVNAIFISDDKQIYRRLANTALTYNLVSNKWQIGGTTENDVLLGDVNQDGVVNSSDLTALNNYLIGNAQLTEDGKKAADVIEDGNIDTSDATYLGNIISGYADILDDAKNQKIELDVDNPAPPQEAIYSIDHSLKNVEFLERMEKCIAPKTFCINTDSNTLHGNYRYMQKYSQCELTVFIDPRTMQPYEPNTDSFKRQNSHVIEGNLRIIKKGEIYYKWTRSKAIDHTSLGKQIIVDSIHFPGTYRLVGETYSRSRKTGKDHRYQFEIPLCKMGTQNSLVLQADGDPTTFNMSLKVLRREDGVMMKLTQYSTAQAKYNGVYSDSTVVVPSDEIH